MEKITFGRSQDCDIVFDDKIVSRYHGYLLIKEDKVYVVDNNSLNGVYVNGKRIQGKALLSSQDKVMISKKLVFDWQDYVNIDDEGYEDGTSLYSSLDDNESDNYTSQNRALIDIPSKMEINQNYAHVYRNGEEGADWKVPFKRNIGSKVGDAVGSTLGCVLSIVIVMIFCTLLALIFN